MTYVLTYVTKAISSVYGKTVILLTLQMTYVCLTYVEKVLRCNSCNSSENNLHRYYQGYILGCYISNNDLLTYVLLYQSGNKEYILGYYISENDLRCL